MILGNKPPEELSLETLMSLAVVLNSIKIASDSSGPSTEVKTLPLEFKLSKIAGMPISRDNIMAAEKSKVEIINYLIAQGAIEDYKQEPLVKSPLGRHTRPDFLVTIKPTAFEDFYKRTMPLALTRVEAKMMYQSQPEASIENPAMPSRKAVLPEVLFTLGDFSVHKGHIASYKGQEVPMELQVSKVATFIMERSTNGSLSRSH